MLASMIFLLIANTILIRVYLSYHPNSTRLESSPSDTTQRMSKDQAVYHVTVKAMNFAVKSEELKATNACMDLTKIALRFTKGETYSDSLSIEMIDYIDNKYYKRKEEWKLKTHT